MGEGGYNNMCVIMLSLGVWILHRYIPYLFRLYALAADDRIVAAEAGNMDIGGGSGILSSSAVAWCCVGRMRRSGAYGVSVMSMVLAGAKALAVSGRV